jgi:hypothetical protein
MTARDGFPRDMDRFALDAGTAERLVAGAVDVADAPPAYRGVARTLQALREVPDSPELFGEQAAVERIAAAVVLERPSRRARRSRRTSLRAIRFATAAVVSCGMFLAGGLASVGALPEPAQNAASAVLGKVGISVPTGGDDPTVDAPPTTTPGPAEPPTTPGGQSNPGASVPDVTAPPPRDLKSTSPPGNDRGDVDGKPDGGTGPEPAKGQGNPDSPNGAPKGAGGKDHDR